MRNKKGFAIGLMEIIKLGIVLLFGIFSWLVYVGMRDWIVTTFGLTTISSIIVGLGGLLIILLFVKFNPLKFGI